MPPFCPKKLNTIWKFKPNVFDLKCLESAAADQNSWIGNHIFEKSNFR